MYTSLEQEGHLHLSLRSVFSSMTLGITRSLQKEHLPLGFVGIIIPITNVHLSYNARLTGK